MNIKEQLKVQDECHESIPAVLAKLAGSRGVHPSGSQNLSARVLNVMGKFSATASVASTSLLLLAMAYTRATCSPLSLIDLAADR